MKNILKSMAVLPLLMLLSNPGRGQAYNFYQGFDAVMLQVGADIQIESRLNKAIIVLSNNSNQLNVKVNIPCHPVNYIPEDNTVLSVPGLPFNLTMTVNPWNIQDEITSAKVFIAQGIVTINNIAKAVKVEYMPLPAGTEQQGDFKISMVIQFDPCDFELDEQDESSQIIIKIGDAKVNRV